VSRGVTLNSDLSLANNIKLIAGLTLLDVYRIDQKVSAEKIPQLQAPAWSGTFTFSYSLDQIGLSADLTGRINGPMYLPVVPNDYRPAQSPVYGLINLQFTKVVNKRWELYAGVKNLLNFIPKDPLLRPFDPFDRAIQVDNPFGYTFDTSYNYAPMQGIKGFLGIRFTLL